MCAIYLLLGEMGETCSEYYVVSQKIHAMEEYKAVKRTRKYAGERNLKQVMRKSLIEVTFKHKLKGGIEGGQVKYYNGLSEPVISWTVKEGSKYSRQDW